MNVLGGQVFVAEWWVVMLCVVLGNSDVGAGPGLNVRRPKRVWEVVPPPPPPVSGGSETGGGVGQLQQESWAKNGSAMQNGILLAGAEQKMPGQAERILPSGSWGNSLPCTANCVQQQPGKKARPGRVDLALPGRAIYLLGCC